MKSVEHSYNVVMLTVEHVPPTFKTFKNLEHFEILIYAERARNCIKRVKNSNVHIRISLLEEQHGNVESLNSVNMLNSLKHRALIRAATAPSQFRNVQDFPNL